MHDERKEDMMMKKIMEKFEHLMTAVTFAEAGEHSTAIRIMNEMKRKDKRREDRPPRRPDTRLRT